MKIRIADRNGDGRGRAVLSRRTVLVSQAHPGEEITVRVDKTTRGTVQGRVAQVLDGDPERQPHLCEHEFRCTGCAFLAAPLSEESSFKEARIREVLRSISPELEDRMQPVVVPTEAFGYRAFTKMVAVWKEGAVRLGSYVTGTHLIADNRGCPILKPRLAQIMDRVAEVATEIGIRVHDARGTGLRYVVGRVSERGDQAQLVLVSSDDEARVARALGVALGNELGESIGIHILANNQSGNVILDKTPEHLSGPLMLEEELLGFRHQLPPGAFFQINPAAAQELFTLAVEAAGKGARVVEGYAGVGALTLPLAQAFDAVDAIESHPGSVQSLRAAAENASPTAALRVHEGRVAEVLKDLPQDPVPDAVVMDPPRAGMGEEVTRHLVEWGIPRVVLLSCEPAQLGRDLPALLGAGYRLRTVTPVDQFPRTAHVEVLSVLER